MTPDLTHWGRRGGAEGVPAVWGQGRLPSGEPRPGDKAFQEKRHGVHKGKEEEGSGESHRLFQTFHFPLRLPTL